MTTNAIYNALPQQAEPAEPAPALDEREEVATVRLVPGTDWKSLDFAEGFSLQAQKVGTKLFATRPAQTELAEALQDAAQSLETISKQAGRDEFMQDMVAVRGYANSRATVARAALALPSKESSYEQF